MNSCNKLKNQSGVALLMATFVIGIASVVVVSLTYSTYLRSRVASVHIRSLQAQYLLKSAINVARTLIKQDKTAHDSLEDPWGLFYSGITVDPAIVGIQEPNTTISLEIQPEEAKMPLNAVLPLSNGNVNIKWRDAIACLFKELGFDDDGEVVEGGQFEGDSFDSRALVSNLIDYLDQDTRSYDGQGSFPSGIEGELPEEEQFANDKLRRATELRNIPGFTAARIRKLLPLVTVNSNGQVNVNLVPRVVLQCLYSDIDAGQAEQIVALRKETPFDSVTMRDGLQQILGSATFAEISPMITIDSRWFQIIAKVDYGTSTYFARALVSQATEGEASPVIRLFELF